MRENSDTDFTIGRLSAETGVNIETIRYYERIALLTKPMRSSGGRRLYDQSASRRLGFIRPARRIRLALPTVTPDHLAPAPPGLVRTRSPRYAQRRCGPRSPAGPDT